MKKIIFLKVAGFGRKLNELFHWAAGYPAKKIYF